MNYRFATAVALAPLVFAASAQAQVVISDARTTPILTSTVDGGSAGDVQVNEDGAVTLTSGVAITGDSNNAIAVDVGATITMEEASDGAAGLLLKGGYAGDLTLGGAVTITDGLEPEDEDADGDVDGAFASGSDRYGLRLAGAGVRSGDILMTGDGSISVQGEDSFGVSIESELRGALQLLGAVSVVGDRSIGVDIAAPIDGDVLISGGSVYAQGEDAQAVAVSAPISGRLQIQSSITSNGYRYTTRPTALADLEEEAAAEINLSDDTLYLEDLDADDLLQAGSALRVSASVAGGILLGAAPTYDDGEEDGDGDGVLNGDDDDVDGDGIDDADEGTASIVTYGAAPALNIGHATDSVMIGAAAADAYGLVNEGSITASGVYDGVSATAVRIGGGTGTTTLEGGLRNAGSITASAQQADAVALDLASGAALAVLANEGSVTASTTSNTATTATTLRVAADANLRAIANSGSLYATAIGNDASAVVVQDDVGSVTSFVNTGVVYAAISAVDTTGDYVTTDETITGQRIAMDFAASTSGVSIVQYGVSDQSATDTDGDGVYDHLDDDDDGDGILDAADDEDGDDDNDGVYDADEPYIYGDVLLGSGADTVSIQNGLIDGDIRFGDGKDGLSITGGAYYRGALSDSDGQLDITIENGVLDARQTDTLAVTGLSVGADGEIFFAVDPNTGAVGGYDVAGAASFADGATLSLHLDSLVDGDGQSFRLVTADSLSYGDVLGGDLTGSSPYLIVSTLTGNEAAGTVDVNLRRRTASEIGLSGVETAGYDAFYAALARDEDVMDAFLAQVSRDDFMNLYEQTLPDHSGGTLMTLADGVDAVTQALAGRNSAARPGGVSGWVQEINFYEDKDKTDTYGYRADGFGVAGGYETGARIGAVGVSAAMASADIEDPESEAEEVLSATLLELGLYWRAQGHGWTGWARGGVGYASFESERAIVNDDLYVSNEATWDGYTLAAGAGLSYERRMGRLSLRPELYAEYFRLTESSRRESGGGEAMDLEIDERAGSIASATAVLKIGYALGRSQSFRPELKLGWKQVLSADYGDTLARYISGGSDFILAGKAITGGGPVAGLGFTLANEISAVTVSADAQQLEDFVRYSFLLRASFRF